MIRVLCRGVPVDLNTEILTYTETDRLVKSRKLLALFIHRLVVFGCNGMPQTPTSRPVTSPSGVANTPTSPKETP